MSHGEAKRPLGILSLTALVVASMIGAGVFTTSGFSVADLRSPWLVMAAWAVGGTIALCGALSYGKLAQCLAESGGEYVFLSRFLHPAAGFLGGWVSLLAGFTGAAAFAAVTFDLYAWPAESRPAWLPDKALAMSTCAGGYGIPRIPHQIRSNWSELIGGNQVGAFGHFLVGSILLDWKLAGRSSARQAVGFAPYQYPLGLR